MQPIIKMLHTHQNTDHTAVQCKCSGILYVQRDHCTLPICLSRHAIEPAANHVMKKLLISKCRLGQKLNWCMQGPANVDAIGLLVELGANLWSVMKDADMETPLHMASRSGRLDIVEKLLRCGADYSKKTKVSCFLPHTCVMHGSIKHAPPSLRSRLFLCFQNLSLHVALDL